MSEYRKLGQKELLSINILLDTGEPDDWFPVFTKLFGNGVCAQFFDEKDNCDEYCPLRIRLSDENGYRTLTIEQLLTLQIRMKNEYDGRWYWCPVFVRGRNGIYLNFFDGEDEKDCKRMLRIKEF
ncbi:hypothetical protein [Liquorilactobacillus mali]|uniref:hypothetical protein n=1 Tax=Liquorilactobacillus mali TaxID=1618 RepID=UPI000249170F|nr:hypothetical protein [Liquorilactobacillus mali]